MLVFLSVPNFNFGIDNTKITVKVKISKFGIQDTKSFPTEGACVEGSKEKLLRKRLVYGALFLWSAHRR